MTLEATVVTPATEAAAPVAVLSPDTIGLEGTDPAPGDATYGWEMFTAFVASVLGITIVVAVLALIGSWWMLGIAMVVHVSITATMMRLIYGAFGSKDHAYPDARQAEAVSRAALAL